MEKERQPGSATRSDNDQTTGYYGSNGLFTPLSGRPAHAPLLSGQQKNDCILYVKRCAKQAGSDQWGGERAPCEYGA